MKKILAFIGIFLLLSPMSTQAENEDKIEEIKNYVENALEIYDIPGASLAIIDSGKVIYLDGWGNSSDGTAITKDTPFLIGSMSKPITSLATMMLVEEGKIDLNEPIETYLPSLQYNSESGKSISVLHLLEQTSGISGYEGLKVTDKKNQRTIGEAAEELSGIQLSNEPGTHYEYTSANYLLLGAIIESVSEQTFSDFVEERIFKPLNMKQTAADYNKAIDKGFVPGFNSWLGKTKESDRLYDHAGAPYGYIVSSANDLAKFLTFMLEGGELLSEQSLEQIKTPPEDNTYGLGWHFSKEEKFPFHGGATSDYRGEMFLLPEKDFAAVLLTNKYHIMEDAQVSLIMKGIRSIISGEEPEPLKKSKPTFQWTIIGITALFGIFTAVQFLFLRKNIYFNHKILLIHGGMSIIIAVALIPFFSLSIGVPWKTIRIFAPDIAFLTYCLIFVVAINGFMNLSFPFFIKKKNN